MRAKEGSIENLGALGGIVFFFFWPCCAGLRDLRS